MGIFFFFLFRLAFTQPKCVSGKGFLIHRNTAAQPSLFPWIGISDYLSLPFMFLTLMNFLFSWNGQKLGRWESGLGGIAGTVFMEKKNPPSWTRFATYLAQIYNCFLYQAHKCSVWDVGGDAERWDKPFLWTGCIAFPFFPAWRGGTQSPGKAGPLRAGCAQRLTLTDERTFTLCVG